MPEKVKINKEKGILEVELSGDVIVEHVSSAMKQVHEILSKKGINKLLVDSSKQTSAPKTFEIHALISNFPPGFKIALFCKETQEISNDVQFVETIGINKGFPIQMFFQKEEAVQWLIGE